MLGAGLFPIGIAAERLGGSKFVVVIGAITVFIGTALFTAVVFRGGKGQRA